MSESSLVSFTFCSHRTEYLQKFQQQFQDQSASYFSTLRIPTYNPYYTHRSVICVQFIFFHFQLEFFKALTCFYYNLKINVVISSAELHSSQIKLQVLHNYLFLMIVFSFFNTLNICTKKSPVNSRLFILRTMVEFLDWK